MTETEQEIQKLEAELFRLGEQQFAHQQQAEQHSSTVRQIEIIKIGKTQELEKLRKEKLKESGATQIESRITGNGDVK